MSIEVRGVEEVQRALAKAQGAQLRRTLQKATKEGAKVLKPHAQRAAPRKSGKLRRSITVRAARRQKPASLVVPRPKVAWYRHIVIGGARPHRIRFPDQKAAGVPKTQGNIRHPGAKANPFIARTGRAHEREALEAARRVLDQELP